jgi:hypothetical protein
MTFLTDEWLGRAGSGRLSADSPVVDEARPSAARWAMVALFSAATVGVVLRFRMLLLGRSLWLDETMLALNICRRSFSGLLQPLEHDQGAPIGFLYLEKLSILLLGPTELAFRLVPFLASLATLALLYRFCATNFGRWPAALALALAGLSPSLIYYSGELKQYGVDVAVALLILVMASDALRFGLSAGRVAGLALVGMASVWLSHPSVFVLAGAGTTLMIKEALERRYRWTAVLVLVAASWLANFAVVYVLSLRSLGTNQFLGDYWDAGFLSFPPTSPKDVRRYLGVGFGLFRTLYYNLQIDFDLSSKMEVIMGVGWVLGVASLWHRGERRVLALLLAPLGFAVAASMLHKYPLRDRLALFTAAATLPTIAAGLVGLIASKDALSRVAGWSLASCCLLLPAMQAAQFAMERPQLHDARKVLTGLAADWQPGDRVMVDRRSEPPFHFYQAYGGIDRLDRVTTTALPEDDITVPETLAGQIQEHKGQGRVWFLLEADLADPTNDQRQALKVMLDQHAEPLASHASRRYSAYLYRFP